MKRIFICAERRFPKIDASSNRIQYNAEALMDCGYQVIVVGIGENQESDYNIKTNTYQYNSVVYDNVGFLSNSRVKYAVETKKILDKYEIGSSDIAVIYTSNAIYGKTISEYFKKRSAKKIIFDVVEWFQPFQYKFGKLDPRLWLYNYCFRYVYASGKNVIAISKKIENYFIDRKCKTLLLPIITDVNDYSFKPELKSDNEVIQLIYPGNPDKKDDIVLMLKALDNLDESYKKRIHFHMTGMSEQKLRRILGNDAYLIDKLSGTFTRHDWMTADELQKLYDKMNFLFMARPTNDSTLSNFPSKVPELLACGICPITNKVGDFVDYLSDGVSAVLYDDCTLDGCLKVLKKVADFEKSELKQFADEGRKLAKEQFQYQNWVETIGKFMER